MLKGNCFLRKSGDWGGGLILCVFVVGGFYRINNTVTFTDQELLTRYVRERSESAFTQVVERHVDLVYSTALRLVAGETTLADDITQKVFTDLATKAASIARVASLAGWLHTHTRFIALSAIRSERRRRTREHEAAAMHEPNATPELDWARLRPVLDEAVDALRPADRDAIVMRYFQNKSHREVGDALGLSENTARMRIERGLEKLQAHFVRRGITVSSAIIATTISAHSVSAAPIGLGARIAGHSLAGTAAGAGSLGWHILSMSTKTKIILAALATALLASIPITLQQTAMARLDGNVATLEKDNAALKKALGDARAQWRAATVQLKNDAGLVFTTNPASVNLGGGISPSVRVDLATVSRLNFQAFQSDSFKLTNEAISLLGLTPTEAQQMQSVLDDLKKSILAHNLSVLRPRAPDDTSNSQINSFFKQHSGQRTSYQIPSYTDEETAALQQSFLDNSKSILGDDRAKIFVDKAQLGSQQIPGSGGGTAIAFVDGTTPDGKPMTWWMVQYLSKGTSGGGATYFGDGNEAVPQRLEGLFEGIKDNQATPAP